MRCVRRWTRLTGLRLRSDEAVDKTHDEDATRLAKLIDEYNYVF